MSNETVRIVQTKWSAEQKEYEFMVDDPSTGKPSAIVKGASAETTGKAIQAAYKVYKEDWRWRTFMERSRLLGQCADLLEEHMDEIAELESIEMGKPFLQSRIDVKACISSFRMFSAFAFNLPNSAKDEGIALNISTLEPYGVVGGIVPFNWPPIHSGAKIAPALAVGNSIVVKPPEQCPSSIVRIVELINTILPENLVNVVCGGGEVGAEITSNPLIGMVSFTGSPNTGTRVLQSLAKNFTPNIMELGGKNAQLIFEDADIDVAARWVIDGAFFNQGEACTAASRILVHRSLYEELKRRLKEAVPKLRLGPPMDPTTHIGPIVSAVQKERIDSYIQIGIQEGATVLCQGQIPQNEELKGGYWVAPLVFDNVTPDMRIAKEEIFGPVTALIPFDTYQEAIEIANDTPFGLVAGVFSKSFETCWKASRELTCGLVFVNNYSRQFHSGSTPFGGTKASGYGREHALETVKEFGRTKSVRLMTGIGEAPKWFAVSDVLGE